VPAGRRAPLVVALAALLAVLLMGAAPADAEPVSGVDAAALPDAARAALPLVAELTATRCPELPAVWVLAQVQAESGWDAALTAPGPGGPAGLYQFSAPNWVAAGGLAWVTDPPDPDAGTDVLSAEAHLRVAVPWVCANLRAVTTHLQATGKPTAPLDAMLVCHLAGCERVTGSATGVPSAGEADCSERCAQVIARYLAAVHANVDRFGAPVAPPPGLAAPIVPAPWTRGATDCTAPDPTGDGCLTGATRHGLTAAGTAFGGWPDGPVIRSAGCWDEHAWNPRSDHARGRACDLFPTAPGTFAAGADLDAGWGLAAWFRSHAGPLRVRYLIWQGRYWAPDVADTDGDWGRRYTGGGIYDARDATGGHFDHLHISFRE
jgi:hypothetical protein